jgi:membrane protein DedA with SNARE-associated domain/rhodanese-related sulfurtransferase
MHPSPSHAWWDFGYAGIFGCVFLEQIGVPIPAFPALLAAGALVASGELNLPCCILVAVAASLLADGIWYSVGRARGSKVLNLMCKLSWRPDTCVNKTKNAFSALGANTLLFAKFVPGLSTLAPPLAGITHVPVFRFVMFDAAGIVIWALVPLITGAYLQKSFESLESQAYSMIPALPWICGILILAVLAWRYINRTRYMTALRSNLRSAIKVEELKSLLDAGKDIVVLDVRDEISARATPVILPKARWIPYRAVEERTAELPLEKPIVIYCDCPEDQASLAMVDILRHRGATHARALRGGLDEWIAKGFATSQLTFAPATVPT